MLMHNYTDYEQRDEADSEWLSDRVHELRTRFPFYSENRALEKAQAELYDRQRRPWYYHC